MIEAAKRTRNISYAIREVVLPARELEKKGVKVLHLNIGDPNKYDFDTPEHMKDALYKASQEGYNGYAPSEGYPELRAAIIDREKKRNNVDYNMEDICVCTGVTEALQTVLGVSLNPGDEILMPGPTYPQYTLISYYYGGKPIPYLCVEEDGWQPDVDDIRKKINSKTKSIALINPNNQLGLFTLKK